MTAPAAPPPQLPWWVWSNLTEDDARQMDARVQAWVMDHNRHLTTRAEDVIPVCWRQHAALAQELPVQCAAWRAAHIVPGAPVRATADYYTYTLPSFHARLPDLLAPDSAGCLAGQHTDWAELVTILARDEADLDGRGPDNIQVLVNAKFGR